MTHSHASKLVTSELRATARRLFDEIADMSRDPGGGQSRPAYSATETAVLKHIQSIARDAGLSAYFDPGQNLVMTLPEDVDADNYVLVGSHIDTVPNGGNFDGLAGVVAGLLCLLDRRQRGTGFPQPVRVVALRGEESAWFGPCYTASKALTGTLSQDELEQRHRDDDRTLDAHMADVGVNMALVRAGTPLTDLGRILEYIELHIEQGPYLDSIDKPVAIVSGIRGNLRHRRILCIGKAGHSGAVPRDARQDAVMAVAELLMRLDDSWRAILKSGGDLVLTTGVLHTDPASNAIARIADIVEFSIDIRSRDPRILDGMKGLLNEVVTKIGAKRNVRFDIGAAIETPPSVMSPALVARLTSAATDIGIDPIVMASGGGHDAAVFANAEVPSAMIFVRSRNGSHNPEEDMDQDDFLKGVALMRGYLLRTGDDGLASLRKSRVHGSLL